MAACFYRLEMKSAAAAEALPLSPPPWPSSKVLWVLMARRNVLLSLSMTGTWSVSGCGRAGCAAVAG